jgi:3,4-dihydroxy 2-butanone 4-phosphate synthase/GTP cyclohydrolase II
MDKVDPTLAKAGAAGLQTSLPWDDDAMVLLDECVQAEPVLVRMHQANLIADSLGDTTAGHFYGGEARARGGELEASMRLIAQQGRGIIVIIREASKDALSRAVRGREGDVTSVPIHELRQYGLGAQILFDLGARNIILLSNTKRTVVGLDGYGITLVGQQPIPPV